jgi:outer membrane lipopolysaccharide assembly protein LptE/RlpB
MRTLVLLFLLFPMAGCGYHAVGSASHLPAGVRTLAVPIFANKTQAYRTEVAYTQAVVRELNLRTKYRVENQTKEQDDAVLRGTILSQVTAPLTYDSTSGQTSSYMVTITASAVLTGSDGQVLWRNDDFAFKAQFQSTQDLNNFIQEDSAAVNRVARDFAQALVSSMLEGF